HRFAGRDRDAIHIKQHGKRESDPDQTMPGQDHAGTFFASAAATRATISSVPALPPDSTDTRSPGAKAASTASVKALPARFKDALSCRSPIESSIIAPGSSMAVGLASPLPAISGAVP